MVRADLGLDSGAVNGAVCLRLTCIDGADHSGELPLLHRIRHQHELVGAVANCREGV